MTDKVTLLDFGSDYQSKQNLNANNVALRAALDNTLSRDGTSPNTMGANFDMNGHRILNLPTPTNPTDAVRLEDVPTVLELEAIRDEAEAAATSAADSLAAIEEFGVQYPTTNNIFKLIEDPTIIAGIQARTYSGFLDTYFQEAFNTGGAWFFPAGTYHLNDSLTVGQGVNLELWGAGIDNTIVIWGNTSSGSWAISQHNPDGINTVEGFKVRDMTNLISNNGFQWNDPSGGFTDDNTSQYYISHGGVERCKFNQNSAYVGTMIQFNKAFNGWIRDTQFQSCGVAINFNGSDLNMIDNCRSDGITDGVILIDSFGSFGSGTKIDHFDFNQSTNYYVNSSDLDLAITNCHLEMDGPAGSTGVSGNMPVAILLHDNCFHNKIVDNRVQVGVFCDNWLGITAGQNLYYLEANGNTSSGPSGSVSIAGLPYFNNSGTRTFCSHRDNTSGETGFPMNTSADATQLPASVLAQWTPSMRGLTQISYNPECQAGDLKLTSIATQGSLVEFSDFSIPIIGSGLVVTIKLYATGTSGVHFSVFDGSTQLVTQNPATTTSPKPYTVASGPYTATTGLKVRVWNDDGDTVFLQSITITLP